MSTWPGAGLDLDDKVRQRTHIRIERERDAPPPRRPRVRGIQLSPPFARGFMMGFLYMLMIILIISINTSLNQSTKECQCPATFNNSEQSLGVRLPRSLKPLHYLVKLQPLISGNFRILGYMEVEIKVLEATNKVILHMADIVTHNNTIKLVPLGATEGPGVWITSNFYDNERQFYIAELGETLVAGTTYVLSMEFEGYLNDKLHGFYRSTYQAEDGSDRLLASTQFQPTDARRAFPCFDEPGMKATFEIFLGREMAMSSITNMPKLETIPIEGQPGWVWDCFITSVPMSTYLVAFVISDFKYMSSNAIDHILFRVWAREAAIDHAKFSLSIGPEMLAFFEEYFSVRFPLPKQDMVAIPDFAGGAMENWGLITFRESDLLLDPALSSASNKQRVAKVVAHELAHQWFGNLVTPEWWTDLWLNEGFASFMENLAVNYTEPSWRMMEQHVLDLQKVLTLDCLNTSHPISMPVEHPDEINEIFDHISYKKGASLINMMNHFLTETTFRNGVSNYLTNLKFQNAKQDDLWEYLTAAAHVDGTLPTDMNVKQIMDTWTLQKGYPVIKVQRNIGGRVATVTQERFVLVKNSRFAGSHNYKWWVPLSYTTEANADFELTSPRVWMKDTEEQITISSLPAKDKWVIFNVQQTGYYRVNYDLENWNLIIQQLKENHEAINVKNRAQIIDDVMNLAKAGQLSYDIALHMNSYLSKEAEYVPWESALSNLDYLNKMFTPSTSYRSIRTFLLDILTPLYNSVGFEDSLNDPHLEQLKRAMALSWACDLGYQDCLSNSVALFQAWKQNPTNMSIISPNLRTTVYCTGVAEGTEDDWDFIWEQYLLSNFAAEKSKLLAALGCSKKVWILLKYLDMAFTADSDIEKQDVAAVFSAVARNDVHKHLAWSYLRDRWQKIAEYYGSNLDDIATFIKASTSSFKTEVEMAELRLFQIDHSRMLGAANRALDEAVERTQNNMNWVKTNHDTIAQWLEENHRPSEASRLPFIEEIWMQM